jgi:hypothetical protein
MRSACAVLRHLLPVPLYHIFPHYLINDTIFGKKLLNMKCVFWFSLHRLSETFLIPRRNERDIVIIALRLHVRYPSFLPDVNEPSILSAEFRKALNCQIPWKSVQREHGCSVRTDGQTDRYELTVAGRSFANVRKNFTFWLRIIFMCLVWIWEQTAIISIHSINWLVIITEMECVYCAVRTECLCVLCGSENKQRLFMECVYCAVRTECLCVLCGSENKQRLFPYTALTGWFL